MGVPLVMIHFNGILGVSRGYPHFGNLHIYDHQRSPGSTRFGCEVSQLSLMAVDSMEATAARRGSWQGRWLEDNMGILDQGVQVISWDSTKLGNQQQLEIVLTKKMGI